MLKTVETEQSQQAMEDMSEKTSEKPLVEAWGNHILIIDDSNQICSLLVSSIISQCAAVSRNVQVVQASALGLLVTMPIVFSQDDSPDILTIYTANNPKSALPVLQLNTLSNLTIICDIMTPADTEVGLFGLLEDLTAKQVPVNLVFASSEGQNRYYVEQLIKQHKAFFVEKGSQAWMELPFALVHRRSMFQYKTIVRSDYDSGFLRGSKQKAEERLRTPEIKKSWWQKLFFWWKQ
ncbi:MAG: hypothetical protein HXX08_18630 [Chloroflexi bacterium]|uniref:Uncharacterized protein n=1 Tax=Candidatus Chlorohelix allophototropha TaxID=3003348 RepID=A0A8T7M716_9CHLR|nr:hypothetical protein [Chloroflexota bacterium]WJW69778.1 hypothetical protein OZ401_003408 [Chloroflexota bacterium L227-S17]